MPGQRFTIHRGTKHRGMGLPMQAHGEAQLTFAASGMVQVHTGEGRWLVPPQLAVWIPAEVQHRVEVLTDAELWMVHWQPSVARRWAPTALLGRAFALRVTSLLRALLSAALGHGEHSVFGVPPAVLTNAPYLACAAEEHHEAVVRMASGLRAANVSRIIGQDEYFLERGCGPCRRGSRRRRAAFGWPWAGSPAGCPEEEAPCEPRRRRIAWMCSALDVSRSDFHAWLTRRRAGELRTTP